MLIYVLNRMKVNGLLGGQYSIHKNIRFKISCIDACIVLKKKITGVGTVGEVCEIIKEVK